jgi:hypothetical protein
MRVVGFILRHKLIFLGLVVLTGLLVYYLLFTMPNAQAVDYVAKMRPGITSAKELFDQLSGTTEQRVFADPDTPIADKQQQLAFAATVSQKTIVALNNLQGDASQLGSPMVAPTNEYQQAADLKAKLLPIIGQGQEVLKQYALLLEFLSHYYQTQVRLQPLFNVSEPLPNETRQELRQEAEKFANLQVPAEFKSTQDKLVGLLNDMAGSNEPALIMKEQNQTIMRDLFGIIARPCQTLKYVVQLPEKFESNGL